MTPGIHQISMARKRFLGKVRREYSCWRWTACVTSSGYGRFSLWGRAAWAHRAAWALFKGSIPPKMNVLHKCDVTQCVNPRHLFLGTQADNVKDAIEKERHAYGERCGQAKLREADVLKIRKDKRSHKHIARIYGVSKSLISMVKAKTVWGWL